MKRLLLLGITVLVTALAIGWLPGSGATGASAATVNVDVADNVFTPGMITVTAGDTVHWAWSGSNPHSVESTSSEAFSSNVQTAGTFDHTFNTAGTFTYQCGVHGAAMTGTVVVQAAAAPTNTASASTNTPSAGTNTPAAGATNVPADTATAAIATSAANTPAAGGTVAAGAATPTRTGGAVLPATGSGDDGGPLSRTWLAGALALAGLAAVALAAGTAITRCR